MSEPVGTAARRRIALLSTGGTIAMTASRRGAEIALCGADIGARVADAADIDLTVVEVFAKPSANIGLYDMARLTEVAEALAAAGDVDGIVIAHGTDTIEETAWGLDLMTRSPVPIVVTGAMRTADAPGADGLANLIAACQVAASPQACGLGVLVVFAEEIHAASLVRKTRTFGPYAFSSEPLGPLGWVCEGRVQVAARPTKPVPRLKLGAGRPVVPVVVVHAGFEPEVLELFETGGVDGLVLCLPGGGHAPAVLAPTLERLAARMPVVFCTRTRGFQTLSGTYGYAGGEMDLIQRGLIAAGSLDALKARCALALLLSGDATPETVRGFFEGFAAS
ncbi:asparaginase [Brevundimonas sp. NPDC090276]|uniref:asparaginase n=1 Tax=Brevundimonas sp. NPDC090276 TaxID=3363956 RepID=UPI00383A06E7